jgi:acetolactate synthase-1/2/3 large subunit
MVLRAYEPGHFLGVVPTGTLGIGAPYAIAAKLARPDKQVVLVTGDGSFGLNAMEFDTMVRHKIPIVSIISNDQAWGMIMRDQLRRGDDRIIGTKLRFARYDKVVEALGGYGEAVERPEDIRPALQRAFASGLPACINVKVGFF